MARSTGNQQYTVASLFSGCGGFDLGFHQAGFRGVGAFDIEQAAVQTYSVNLRSPAYKCDLTENFTALRQLRKVDVLLSGSPCQGFSVAGKRDPNDPRNSLLLLGGQIAVKVKPKVFIAENVVGVLSGCQKRYWDQLHLLLRSGGYNTADIRCNANTLGVAQLRQRAILFAWLDRPDLEINIRSCAGGVVRDVLRGLNNVANHNIRSPSECSVVAAIARRIGSGQKLSNVRGGDRAVHTWHIPEVFGKTSREERRVLEAMVKLRRQNRSRSIGDADPVGLRDLDSYLARPSKQLIVGLATKGYVRRFGNKFDLAHTFNGKFRRLSWDAPSPTVDTRFGEARYFLHPSEHRGLTVREAARIQGFPDTFVFSGCERSQYRLVGNAVPPPMARCIANFVIERMLR